MHILLVADGRSPIARHWAAMLISLGHTVSLVSTFPYNPIDGLEAQLTMPVAFNNLSGSQVSTGAHTGQNRSNLRRLVGRFRNLLLAGRYTIGPMTLPYYGKSFRQMVEALQPDVVHALRIPFEGMLASYTPPGVPLLVSIWGNDLTLHANGSSAMQKWTRRTLDRANGLMADAARDLRLGRQWGFAAEKPVLLAPGAGGIDLGEIRRAAEDGDSLEGLVPDGAKLVVNPRGFRPGSVRNDVFFQAIPLVLQRMPDVYFACAAMQGQKEAEEAVDRYHLRERVRLLPYLTQSQLWDLFLKAQVSVSISEHDGTPNSLLEAMACGCFPIAGDIESLREWITPGINGFLVEPNKPPALADALMSALQRPELRAAAAEHNLHIIQQRADQNLVRAQVQVFYHQFEKIQPEPPADEITERRSRSSEE